MRRPDTQSTLGLETEEMQQDAAMEICEEEDVLSNFENMCQVSEAACLKLDKHVYCAQVKQSDRSATKFLTGYRHC